MRGVILAGGRGTRLGLPYNKHTALVYDKPMIHYPLETLKQMGCDSAVVVSSAEGVSQLAECLTDLEMEIIFKVQRQPNGAADALRQAEGLVEGTFPVLCGDVYFDPPPEPSTQPTLYWHEFETGDQHSVYDPETHTIVEKPLRDIGKRAIVAYMYDERAFDIISTLKPSERGELELVDLHRYYLEKGAPLKEYTGFFGDMGTPDGLLRVATHEWSKDERN